MNHPYTVVSRNDSVVHNFTETFYISILSYLIMKKYLVLTFVLLMSGCNGTSQQTVGHSSSQAMSSSSSLSSPSVKEPTVSFFIPEGYTYVRFTSHGRLEGSGIAYSEVVASVGNEGETAQISVLRTSDPKILAFLGRYAPGQKVTIGGIKMQKFVQQNMQLTQDYVYKVEDEYIVISFDGPPSDDIQRKVIESVQILN
ncbi:MAG: hypothetical protein JWM56_686 [Candidatus Peribacteria bacterium]|nr:hypothetical protein [Candidatus Peribacteria bacterium]